MDRTNLASEFNTEIVHTHNYVISFLKLLDNNIKTEIICYLLYSAGQASALLDQMTLSHVIRCQMMSNEFI